MPPPVRRQHLAAIVVLAAGTGLALAAPTLAANGGFTPPTPRSPNASRISDAYDLILGLTAAIFVIVEATLILFIVRFRNRGRPRTAEGPQIRGNTRLELIWTAAPVVALAAIASFVFYKLPGIKDPPSARAAGPHLNVEVEGRQFYWQFTYPNGVIAIDRLRAPQDRVVTLDITSPDVNHSWWIPSLGGKFDAIPGKTNHLWFQTKNVGVYRGQCAEFCGLYHASMKASVEVMPRQEFESWLMAQETAQRNGTSDLGEQEFEGVCAKCHGFRAQGSYGPKLTPSILSDAKSLETVIRNGRGRMPAVGKGWTDAQVKTVIRYLQRTFGGSAGGG